jgi:hypothetical protein
VAQDLGLARSTHVKQVFIDEEEKDAMLAPDGPHVWGREKIRDEIVEFFSVHNICAHIV